MTRSIRLVTSRIPPTPRTRVARVRGQAVLLAVAALLYCNCAGPRTTQWGTPTGASGRSGAQPPTHLLPLSEAVLRDKLRGAWLGQMIGVSWGFPTEFYAHHNWQMFPDLHQVDGTPQNTYAAYDGGPIPVDRLPAWKPELINGAYSQDDLYVEVPFMEALAHHGVNAGWAPLSAAFARSTFPLWHANAAGRENLRAGLRAPASGHYAHSGESDDIDWQIEADFVGLMNPAQPDSAADLAFRAGHLMNYGDGVYGGVFVATMIATAFTADSVCTVADAGRLAVPPGSAYRHVLDEVHAAWLRGDSYDANLAALYAQWGGLDRCAELAGPLNPLNIDAKFNGAFILLGLLYGEGDLAASLRYAMAAGQDSDCNPSSVGSILGALYGSRALAADRTDWLSQLDLTQKFETTPYGLDELVDMNLELARAVVLFKGGTAPGGGTWQIPVIERAPTLILEQWPLLPNDPPALTATARIESDRTVRVGAHATDADGIRAYQWFFGDLTYASGPAHRHTYRAPGTYELIAYVADTTGNTSCQVLELTVP